MESKESSSPLITRSICAAYQGEIIDTYDFPWWEEQGLKLLGMLPQEITFWAVRKIQAPGVIRPEMVARLDFNQLLEERIQDYRDLPGKFPAIVTGAGMGGASAHLTCSVGGVFLPQAFVFTLEKGSESGNVQEYYNLSAGIARHLTDRIPEILTIQHFDPVHDGWLTRKVNHLRLKLIDLPEAYKEFIRERLAPGGTVIYLDGQATWLQYRTGKRNRFQVGGWGGISPEEFLKGSQRLSEYCRREKIQSNWEMEGYPLETGFESEWGCEPGLRWALEEFCQKENIQFIPISCPDPSGFSRLAYMAARYRLAKEGLEPSGVLIETFTQFDATMVERYQLLPLWLIFNTEDSLSFLKKMRSSFLEDLPVFISPLATFSQTPDMVPWEEWTAGLEGLPWRNVGARRSHYPADARVLVSWKEELREWCKGRQAKKMGFLTGEELERLQQEG